MEGINKEIGKLKYYMEQADDLIKASDFDEMQSAVVQATKISERIAELIIKSEEEKIDAGESSRNVRQWKKETKGKYSDLLAERDKLVEVLDARSREKELQEFRAKQELQERLEQADDLIKASDFDEMQSAVVQATKISERVAELIIKSEEEKIDAGESSRNVRQWKKETKGKYSDLLAERDKLVEVLDARSREKELQEFRAKQEL